MNYVPAQIPFSNDSIAIDKLNEKSPTGNSIQIDTQCGDCNEYQLSVSSTDSGLFEGSDQISVSDVPSDQRKKNSFYRWFKRKLWCIRRSKSSDSNRIKSQTFRNAKIEIRKAASERKSSESPKPEPALQEELATVKKPTGVKTIHPATPAVKKPINDAPSLEVPEDVKAMVQKTPQVVPAKERQVTFSDTVKTHIKTKYITAEEYQQIRGMDMNNRNMLYQYNQSAESTKTPKKCIVEEKNTFVRNKADHRKCKHVNENPMKV